MKAIKKRVINSYRLAIKFIRAIVEHKRFRSILSAFFVAIVFVVGIFPHGQVVFGQTNYFATEEIVMSTKRTSRFPIVGPLSQGFTSYHPGIDIEGLYDSSIHPFLNGSIAETGYNSGGYGNYILIDHKNGYFSLYAHLNKVLVKRDDEVTQDSVLGTVGLTGYTTGAHLHIEIYENGIAVNPLTILPESPQASSSGRGAFTGGPASIPSKTLIMPISLQTPAFATASAIHTVEEKEEPKEETGQVKKNLGIWSPGQLTESISKSDDKQRGLEVSSILPTLIKF